MESPRAITAEGRRRRGVGRLSPERISGWLLALPALTWLSLSSSGCASAGSGPSEEGSTFAFALLGDNPYPPEDVPKFEALIRDVNSDRAIEWVLHVGDILRPQVVGCADAAIRSRFELFEGFAAPFILTPGDNDWLDCQRQAAGAFEPYERLQFLRQVFFPEPTRTSGGRPMTVRSQSEETGFEQFVENRLWVKQGVVFATVHLVGPPRPPSAADQKRLDAALAWIAEAFSVAGEGNAAGVFLATQVDPWVVSGNPGLVRRFCPRCVEPRAGLEPLYPALRQHALAFDGPVVLAVGDTHVFRVDKPLYDSDGTLIENFTRVEPFGNPDVHWVEVRVDPETPPVFAFEQRIVGQNVD